MPSWDLIYWSDRSNREVAAGLEEKQLIVEHDHGILLRCSTQRNDRTIVQGEILFLPSDSIEGGLIQTPFGSDGRAWLEQAFKDLLEDHPKVEEAIEKLQTTFDLIHLPIFGSVTIKD